MTDQREGFAKPVTNTWKPGKPGDEIMGVYTDNVRPFEGKYGPTFIYELIGLEGSFHNLGDDEKPITPAVKIEPGEFYTFFERNTLKEDINRAKYGQQVLIKFVENRKPKTGGKPYKYVECQLGPMDETWLAENPRTEAPPQESPDDEKPF